MYETKTKVNDQNPRAFIEKLTNEKKKQQSFELLALMTKWTGFEPKMWGDSIIGYGMYSYTNRSGHFGEWLVTGFSPRKASITVYVLPNLAESKALLDKLGKHKEGKGCIYINKLEDVNLEILEQIVKHAYEHPLVQGE